MSVTKRYHGLTGWRDEPDDNDFGAPWTNFGPFDKPMRVYIAPTFGHVVIAPDETEAVRLAGQTVGNFRKVYRDVGGVTVREAGTYKHDGA